MQTYGLRASSAGPTGGFNFRQPNHQHPKTIVAIFHLSVKTVSRSAGRSATAAAAYRAGVEITDQRTGEIHDYRRKAGVESAQMFLPAGAPNWATDRADLWNAAEQSETRKNSTVAREFEVALPSELSADQRRELAHDFTQALVNKYGFVADCAIHQPGKEGDTRNHHAHILCTTRKLTPEGFTTKTRELDDRATGAAQVVECRELFATMTNAALKRAGQVERVDHRSLEAQGIEREASIHLGPAAAAIERRGETSEKTQHHQERQQEAAGKVAAMVAIAQAQVRAQQQELEDDRIRIEAFSFLAGNVDAAKRTGRATNRALAFTKSDLAGIEQSLGAAGANLSRVVTAIRAPNQHLAAARETWASTVGAVRASENDLGTAAANLGRAVEIAGGRQHHRHAGAVAQAVGRGLKRLVPAIAAAARQVDAYLVDLARRRRAMEPIPTPALANPLPTPEKTLKTRLSESWEAMTEWVKGREGVLDQIKDGSGYAGPVLHQDDLHCVQKTGRAAYAIHQLDQLSQAPQPDNPKTEIRYRGGVGQVAAGPQTRLGIGR